MTARLFEVSVQRVRGSAVWPLAVVAGGGLVVWTWLAVAPVLSVAFLAALVAGTWQFLGQHMPVSSGWPRAARRLLAEQPWRELPVTVLDRRGTVVALSDGSQLRVHGLSRVAREVAVRAGRIWVVGPDRTGWFAARVDGLYTPWPAHRVKVRSAAPAMPGTEPIVTLWGRYRVERARGDLWYSLVATVVLAALSVFAGESWGAGDVVGGDVVGGAVVVGGVVAVVLAVRQLRRTVRLRDAGPWHRGEATVSSWTNRLGGVGDGIIAVRFPDGHRYTVELERVPLDLFANAWREEMLWVAPGGVVGFRDYPVAVFAEVVPEN